jgi:hypothetical protein
VAEVSEKQTAHVYDDRTTAAVKKVLLEIGQILGSYKGKFAVIGGAVPWLLLDNPDMHHVGTFDVDLSLDAEKLGDGEYAGLVESLMEAGYAQRNSLKRFQLVRTVPADDEGASPIEVVVDFLMPRHADIVKNSPGLVPDFAVQRADGADLALRFYQMVAIDGPMPDGGTNKVEIAVASIPALLAMKGFAITGRHKQKDAYDIYYCIRNFEGGAAALAEECRPLLDVPEGLEGFKRIAEKFDTVDGYGPYSVRLFVLESRVQGDRTADQWQQDAFGQVEAWLKALGLRT